MIIVAAPGTNHQISRPVLGLLLLGAALAVAPHILRLFPGLIVFGVLAVGWGLMVQAGRWQPPSTLIKAALAVSGLVAVLVTARHPLAIEPMIGLALVAYQLKLVETTRRRDGFVVAFTAYFVIATHFLFDQSLGTALYALIAIVIVTAALVAQTLSVTTLRAQQVVVLALRLTLPAVPLAAVVFLLFPRVSPLWTVPVPSSAQTGLGETLRPQDVVTLARNPEVAFRVAFDGIPPPVAQRYWRAMAYYDFIDEEWRIGIGSMQDTEIVWREGLPRADWIDSVRPSGDGYRYRVIMEPTGRQWMYSLGTVATRRPEIGITRDGRLMASLPVVAKFGYAANSTLDVPGDLPDWMRERTLQLPEEGNPRARELAKRLRARSTDDADFVRRVLKFYGQSGFAYTLTPAAIEGRDSIDGFLFGKRRGFCAHFAGSFVFLARVAGIPARLIGGYLGGEQNELGDFVTVRQYDAHAWAELWVAGNWVRVDPTGVVAPDRIRRGVEGMTDSGFSAFATPWGVRRMAGLAVMFSAIDSMEHQWNQWVVGYDAELQARVLAGWLGQTALRTTGLMLIGAIGGIFCAYLLVVLAVNWWRQLRARTPIRGLERWGAGLGYPRRLDETLTTYGERLRQVAPDKAALIAAVVDEACQLLYVDTKNAGRQRALRANLLRLRFAVGTGPIAR